LSLGLVLPTIALLGATPEEPVTVGATAPAAQVQSQTDQQAASPAPATPVADQPVTTAAPPIALDPLTIVRKNPDAFAKTQRVYLDGAEHDETRLGLTAGTFQHELDHLDGVLFLDRVRDPATFTTWEQFARHHRDAFVARAEALTARVGS